MLARGSSRRSSDLKRDEELKGPAGLLALLLDPNIVPGLDARTPQTTAIASLFDGRLDRYDAAAAAAGLPRLGDFEANKQFDGLNHLLQLTFHLFIGKPEAATGLWRLAREGLDAAVRPAAAVLASVALADAGRSDLALEVLMGRTERAGSALEEAALNLHIGIRRAELGQFEPARQATRLSLSIAQRSSRPPLESLRIVAEHNVVAFEGILGTYPDQSPRSRSLAPTLSRVDALSADGLSSFLDAQYDAAFQDPLSRSLVFRNEDPIEGQLARALFRSECLGDWYSCLRLRKSLGRYYLLGGADDSQRLARGLNLLRRAQDHVGLTKGAKAIRASGPIEALQASSVGLVGAAWSPLQTRANLALITHSAFAFDRPASAAIFDQLLDSMPSLLNLIPGVGWVTTEAIDALTAALETAPRESHLRAFDQILDLAQRPSDPLLHQSIPSALHALDWDVLDRKRRSQWLAFAKVTIGSTSDTTFVGIAAAEELIRSGSRSMKSALLTTFDLSGSLLIGRVILGLGLDLDIVRRQRLSALVVEETDRLRSRARSGEYSMGGMSVGWMLGKLGFAYHDEASRIAAIELAKDGNVPIDERVPILNLIAQYPNNLNSRERQRLRTGLDLVAPGWPILGSIFELKAARLRLFGALGSISGPQALAELLELAASGTIEGRMEAARCLVSLEGIVEVPSLASIGLLLSRDREALVRGLAAGALATIRWPSDFNSSELVMDRLRALAQEPGEIVPRLLWLGLASASKGEELDAGLQQLAQKAADGHPAVTVRRAAQQALAS
jgi:hypothetical protein